MAANQTESIGLTSEDVTIVNAYPGAAWLYVQSEDGAGRVTFTVDGATAATDGGDDMYYVPPVAGAYTRVKIPGGTTTVKAIASVATVVSFQLFELSEG